MSPNPVQVVVEEYVRSFPLIRDVLAHDLKETRNAKTAVHEHEIKWLCQDADRPGIVREANVILACWLTERLHWAYVHVEEADAIRDDPFVHDRSGANFFNPKV